MPHTVLLKRFSPIPTAQSLGLWLPCLVPLASVHRPYHPTQLHLGFGSRTLSRTEPLSWVLWARYPAPLDDGQQPGMKKTRPPLQDWKPASTVSLLCLFLGKKKREEKNRRNGDHRAHARGRSQAFFTSASYSQELRWLLRTEMKPSHSPTPGAHSPTREKDTPRVKNSMSLETLTRYGSKAKARLGLEKLPRANVP